MHSFINLEPYKMLFTVIFGVIISCRIRVNCFVETLELSDVRVKSVYEKTYPGEPLYLTPVINSGDIQRARSLSRVKPEIGGYESYSGFFTVNGSCASNLFFWFFPSLSDWKSAQTVLWLQGGPGSSTFYGVFAEIGPFEVTKHGIRLREHTWNVVHNLLFVDQPVGTGYSFTKSDDCYPQDQTAVGRDLYSAVVQFFRLFPELQRNDFFVAGESYGGKYIPALAHAIHINHRPTDIRINLKGLLIGNGWCDPMTQSDYSDYLYQLGLLDLNQRNEFKQESNKFIRHVKNRNFEKAYEIFNNLIFKGEFTLFHNYTGLKNYYDYVNQDLKRNYWEKFVQKPRTRRSLHVGHLDYNDGSQAYVNLRLDIVKSVKPWVESLLEHYRILFYNGQLDIICGYPMEEAFLKSLKWSGSDSYRKANRMQWYVGSELAGYIRLSGDSRLVDILVRNAGHMVPASQPKWALNMLHRFTTDLQFDAEPSNELYVI